MNGNGDGYFYPDKNLTREQAAQLIFNSENEIFDKTGHKKNIGTIENIKTQKLENNNKETIIDIRDTNGDLQQILIQSSKTGTLNEITGSKLDNSENVIVYKNGQIGFINTLTIGDKIKYINNVDNKLNFINVLSNKLTTEYIVAQINSVDTINKKINTTNFMNVDFPDEKITINFSINKSNTSPLSTYTYSASMPILIGDRLIKPEELDIYSTVLLTIENGIITYINSVN